MTETNAARLERIKEEYLGWIEMHDGIVPSEDIQEFGKDAADKLWVIEQAERVQELEKELEIERKLYAVEAEKNRKQLFKRIELKKENKRLREALFSIKDEEEQNLEGYESTVYQIVCEALERVK